MQRVIIGLVAAALTALWGCGSTEKARTTATEEVSIPYSMTMQSIAEVDAVLESVQPGYEAQFTMKLFMIAVRPKPGYTAAVNPGERVAATPLYDTDAAGTPDMTIPRNKALAALRSLPTGSKLTGVLGVTTKGSWHLISVVPR